MTAIDTAAVAEAVLGLDRWFDAMRVDWPTPGYGGPVVHWWRHCLAYRGAGLDWRYEGIIDGYLALWRTSGERRWLAKAIRAGEDLVVGQCSNGHFRNSRFELNPGEGGTPHEAACSVALLLLARELVVSGDNGAERYLDAARRNLEAYWFGRLWHAPSATLWDAVGVPTFVPNKAATFVEAILLLRDLTADNTLLDRYAVPTGEHILAMQMRRPGAVLDGAVAQNRFGDRVVESYFPLYVARCVPALLRLEEVTGDPRFRDGAFAAATFVARVREPDGGLPQVLYGRGRRNRCPRWIAGVGDVVRALALAQMHGAPVDPRPTVAWMMRGMRSDGRLAVAEGFGGVIPWVSRRERTMDEVGVVGWCDKAFRALAPLVAPDRLAEDAARDRPSRVELAGIVR